jgi:hypothetical protein
LASLAHIGGVTCKSRRFRSQARATPFALGGLRDRLARGFRTADASVTSDLVK